MRRPALFLLALFAAILSVARASSQTSDTGFPPFQPQGSFGVDSINESVLNLHVSIPLISKAGQPAFAFALEFDTGSGPGYNSDTGNWTGPTSASGFKVAGAPIIAPAAFLGWISHTAAGVCWKYTYTDPSGTTHPFPNTLCGNGVSGTATDGSGFMLVVGTAPCGTSGACTVYDRSGNAILPVPLGGPIAATGSLTDPNGNRVTVSYTPGPSSSNGTTTLQIPSPSKL